ncbi:MAG TPA: class I SAM-dependent methyltransferase [Pirellulales bacterium]|nr:class I SAM-dependent methyltransferase [Pirellulales bacterium]
MYRGKLDADVINNVEVREHVIARDAYRADLAFIHDAGFGGLAHSAADELLGQLDRAKVTAGTVVELGCGSGILSEKVAQAGFDVVGFDISTAMVALARKRVPKGKFHARSFLGARLPRAVAVVAIGEVFNYLFDVKNSERRLSAFFRRVYDALTPAGLFLFDVAGPGRAGPAKVTRGFTETGDWTCLYEAAEDPLRRRLTRTITTFRRRGATYRRDHEVHELQLIAPAIVLKQLEQAGFRAGKLNHYAAFKFPAGWTACLARKT